MNKIYIDKTSKRILINSILTHDITPVNVMLFKTNFKIYSLLKDTQLLPNVLVDIVNEYNADIIDAIITRIHSKEFKFNIKHNNTVLFDGLLCRCYAFPPLKWFYHIYNDTSLYFDEEEACVDFIETLFIFNQFMNRYYKKNKYINDGHWLLEDYPNYYFKNKCLIAGESNIKLKDARLLKNVIVMLKILTNIITKYYKEA